MSLISMSFPEPFKDERIPCTEAHVHTQHSFPEQMRKGSVYGAHEISQSSRHVPAKLQVGMGEWVMCISGIPDNVILVADALSSCSFFRVSGIRCCFFASDVRPEIVVRAVLSLSVVFFSRSLFRVVYPAICFFALSALTAVSAGNP